MAVSFAAAIGREVPAVVGSHVVRSAVGGRIAKIDDPGPSDAQILPLDVGIDAVGGHDHPDVRQEAGVTGRLRRGCPVLQHQDAAGLTARARLQLRADAEVAGAAALVVEGGGLRTRAVVDSGFELFTAAIARQPRWRTSYW